MSYIDTSVLKNSTIMLLYAERSEIKIDPPYQRSGGVWTAEKKRLLIDSILNDYDIPKIYFHLYSNSQVTETGKRYAVIDGRQRLEAIWDFIDGAFSLAHDFEYQRDPSIDLAGLTYVDIAKQYPKIRIKFDSFVLPVVTVATEDNDLDLIEDMFSRLNEAVPLNAAEKRNAIGGNMVAAISSISQHKFFTVNAKFSNTRFQYKEVAARFILIEDSLQTNGKLIDTKKIYLDAMARKFRTQNPQWVEKLESSTTQVLDYMHTAFAADDELLSAQGTMVVYYLLFRFSAELNELNIITRKKLLDFREKLASNRVEAINNYAESSFELLEYDRLNQQGTNDASSIKERYRIVADFVGVTVADL